MNNSYLKNIKYKKAFNFEWKFKLRIRRKYIEIIYLIRSYKCVRRRKNEIQFLQTSC